MNKPAFTITDQIALLKQRGMIFSDENEAHYCIKNIGYYRLKGYWWDMQQDYVQHVFKPATYFDDVIERYFFDRRLKLILFEAIETVEIAIRARMIYLLSVQYGGLWYLNTTLFETALYAKDGIMKTTHLHTLGEQSLGVRLIYNVIFHAYLSYSKTVPTFHHFC